MATAYPARAHECKELETEPALLIAVLGATALAFYALLGFEDSVNLAEETQKPRRDFPRALFGGLAIAGVSLPGRRRVTTSMLVDTDTLAESDRPLLEVRHPGGRPDVHRPGCSRSSRCSRSPTPR